MNTRTFLRRTLLSTVAGLGLAALSSTPALAQTVTLKFAHFLTPNSNFHQNVLLPWCAKIAKDSGDRLKCQPYPALQLGGTPPQLADQVKNGVADIIWTSASYTPGRFLRTEALELPFTQPPTGLAGSLAMWEFYEKHAREDYTDFHVVGLFSGSNVIIATKDKPVLDLSGFSNLKLRSPSRAASRLLTALGGSPVNMPPPQITEGISKGVIDGAMAPWEVIPAVKIDEVAKYYMEGPANRPGFTQNPMIVLMNRKRYESLPADLKKVIDANSGRPFAELAGKSWDDATAAARKNSEKLGNRMLVLKPADYDAMQKAAASVETDFLADTAKRGIDGKALAQAAREIGAKYLPK